jgi:predicted PurR-regulated permease PerM
MAFPGPTPKQARILWMSATAVAISVMVLLIGVVFWAAGWLLNTLASVLLPLAIAGILAYLLDPVVNLLERYISRGWAILTVFFLALLIVAGILAAIIPRLVVETHKLIQNWPHYSERIQDKVQDFLQDPPFPIPVPAAWRDFGARPAPLSPEADPGTAPEGPPQEVLSPGTEVIGAGEPRPKIWETEMGERVIQWASGALVQFGRWILEHAARMASWAGLLIGLALVPVYTFYFLWEKKGISAHWTDYLPFQESWIKQEVVFVLKSINHYLVLFFRGQVLVALCDGVLLTIGFLIIGLDFAVILGMVAGLLSIVPFLGIVLSIIPALIH